MSTLQLQVNTVKSHLKSVKLLALQFLEQFRFIRVPIDIVHYCYFILIPLIYKAVIKFI